MPIVLYVVCLLTILSSRMSYQRKNIVYLACVKLAKTKCSEATMIEILKVMEANGPKIGTAEDIARSLDIASASQEMMYAITLNQKNVVIATHLVMMGTLSECLVHPREVFRHAIADAAARFILVHNHPSGNVTPSKQDDAITDRFARAGDLIGITLLDHVILGTEGYYSYMDEGKI